MNRLRLFCLLPLTALLTLATACKAVSPVETAPAPQPAATVQTQPTTPAPTETTVPETTVPQTTAPQVQSLTLTFAGDCTLGSNPNNYFADCGFIKTVGDDYGYPFRNVLPYFTQDELTLVNLEGTFYPQAGAGPCCPYAQPDEEACSGKQLSMNRLRLFCLLPLAAVLTLATACKAVSPTETAPAPQPAATVQTQPTTPAPTETTVPEATVPQTTAPQVQSLTLTFAGDCTLGSNPNNYFADCGFIKTLGDDYGNPFRNVLPYFTHDELTLVILEGTFCDQRKPPRLPSPPPPCRPSPLPQLRRKPPSRRPLYPRPLPPRSSP